VYRPKHVEWTCREINSLHIVASVGHSIEELSCCYNVWILINICDLKINWCLWQFDVL